MPSVMKFANDDAEEEVTTKVKQASLDGKKAKVGEKRKMVEVEKPAEKKQSEEKEEKEEKKDKKQKKKDKKKVKKTAQEEQEKTAGKEDKKGKEEKKEKLDKKEEDSKKEKLDKKEKKEKVDDKKHKEEENEDKKGKSEKKSKKQKAEQDESEDGKAKKASNQKNDKTTLTNAEVDAWRMEHILTVTNPDGTNNTLSPFLKFNAAEFPGYIQTSVQNFGFDAPTPIQAQGWPHILEGKDVVGIAETGSGKTLAFGYPAIMHIKNKEKKAGPKVMVLAPTRELAQQIHTVLAKACIPAHLTACCVFGGVPKGPQFNDIKTADIVVATPGRLIDLLQDGSSLGNVDYVVLDEADRMLDMGFIPQIRSIFQYLPQSGKRQMLMFSATWPVEVQKFAQTYLRKPIQINIGTRNLSGAKKVKQIVEVCQRAEDKKAKLKQLLNKLTADGHPRILVFMLYKHTCESLYQELLAAKWHVDSLHGNKSQAARDKAVENFKSGHTNILVATDVASRGLDIKDIKYVINVELPLVMEDYVHRIGRTGRAGEDGTAYTLFCPEDKQHARQLARILEESGQTVPAELSKICETAPVTKPRKTALEQLYGDFARGADPDLMMKKPTKTTFD